MGSFHLEISLICCEVVLTKDIKDYELSYLHSATHIIKMIINVKFAKLSDIVKISLYICN